MLGLLLLLALVSYHEIIVWNFSSHSRPNPIGWFYNLSDTSPQFLYLLALGLLYVRRHSIARAFAGRPAPVSGILLLVPGTLLLGWGRYVGSVDVIYLSFLLVSLGAVRFLSGGRLTREIMIPFLILVLAVPLPAVLNNQIVFPFQLWTAEHAAWILDMFGKPVALEGTDVVLADSYRYSVAESCTALGFIKWLLVFALVFVYLYPVSRLHTLLLILIAPLIAYGVNLLRAVTLILNPALDVLSMHLVQGIVFFMIGFTALYAVDSLLRKTVCADRPPPDASSGPGGGNAKHGQLPVLLVWFALLALVALMLPRWSDAEAKPVSRLAIAEQIDGWSKLTDLSEPRRFLGSVRFTEMLYRFYKRDNHRIALFIGYDDRRDRQRSFLSAKNAYQGRIGNVTDYGQVEIDALARPVNYVLTTNEYGPVLSYSWYTGVESVGIEVLRAMLALDQSPLRREQGGYVFRVATNVAPNLLGRDRAEIRLRDFIATLNVHFAAGVGAEPSTEAGSAGSQ